MIEPATLAAPPATDARRITEADADFARLRDAAERRLTASVRRLVRDLRERPDVEHPTVQSAFIARHIALLRDAYAAGHAEGARDYYDTVSLQPAKWAKALAPDIDERALRERLGFYAPSVAKLANEARMAWQASQRQTQAQQAARRAERAETLAEGQRHDEYPSNGVAGRSGAYAGMLLAAKDTASDPLDAWEVSVQGRIGLQAEIAWPGLMDGYVRAGVMDPAAPFSLLWWLMEPGAKHCFDCPRYAANGPYNPPGSGGNVLDATPGDGKTECGAGCKCSLSYVPAGGIEHTVWSVIAPEIERQLATGVPEADLERDADGNVVGWVARDANGNIVARFPGAPADLARDEAQGPRTPPGEQERRASAWGQITDTLSGLRTPQPRPFANYPFPRNPDGSARLPDIRPPKTGDLADSEKTALDRFRAAREKWERVRGTLLELPPMFADATGLPLEDAGALRALLPGTFETLTAEQQAALGDLWGSLLAWDEAANAAIEEFDVPVDDILVRPIKTITDVRGPGDVRDIYDSRLNEGGEAAQQHTGVMLAFMLKPQEARALALPDGEPPDELHLTLAYLGDMDDLTDEQLKALLREVRSFAPEAMPLAGAVSGVARFTPGPGSDGKAPCVALVNVPGLQAWRAALVKRLKAAGLPVAENFEYTPHITLAYVDAGDPLPTIAVPAVPLSLDRLTLAIGNMHVTVPIGDEQYPRLTDSDDAGMTFTGGFNPYRRPDGKFAPGPHAPRQGEHEGGASRGSGATQHAAGHHEGTGGGGGGASGGHAARPFTEGEFGAAMAHAVKVGEVTKNGATEFVTIGGRQYHVKPLEHAMFPEENVDHALAAKEIGDLVGVHVPRGWMVEHEGKPYYVSERAPGDNIRVLHQSKYPMPDDYRTDVHAEERRAYIRQLLELAGHEQLARTWLHEYVIAHDDAHEGNLLIDRPTGTLTSFDHETAFRSHITMPSHFSAIEHYAFRDPQTGSSDHVALPRHVLRAFVGHINEIGRALDARDIAPLGVLARLEVLHNLLQAADTAGRDPTLGDLKAAARGRRGG